jgi:hypothetical protein
MAEPIPETSWHAANRTLAECARSKARFHAIGTATPWRTHIEKLSRQDLDLLLLWTPDGELTGEFESALSAITAADLDEMETAARAARCGKLILAVLALRYALVALKARPVEAIPF